jgi:hypothetical protein
MLPINEACTCCTPSASDEPGVEPLGRGEQLGVEELIPEPDVVDAVERSSYDSAKLFPTAIQARCRPCWQCGGLPAVA